MGIRESLCRLNVLLQYCRDKRNDVQLAFIDYKKIFNKVSPQRRGHTTYQELILGSNQSSENRMDEVMNCIA